jgi:ABC-type uncharacterized transport system permease subunit
VDNFPLGLTMLTGLAHSSIRLATPYLYAALGEMISQRAGVLNLGVEGIMLMGAYVAFLVASQTNNLWLALSAAALVGALLGLLMAVVSVTFQAEQGISGIGLYLFGLGLSSLLFKLTFGTVQSVQGFGPISLPLLDRLPIIGPIFSGHSILVYAAFALVPLVWYGVYRTTFGLQLRAVGQNPEAADAMGVNVVGVRYAAVIVGALLAGVAGASLSIALLNVFQEGLTNGIGFIAVALVYFGGWQPKGVLAGALLFSSVNALQLWVQVLGLRISPDVAVMLPYLLTIVALAFARERVREPAALTKPYERGT